MKLSENYKKRLQELSGIEPSNLVTVYRCIEDKYKKNDKIEFFSINKEYAQHFGDICYEFQLNVDNAKILDLEKWNNLYTEKTGTNGNIYNRVQGLFVIGSSSISSAYDQELKKFRIAMGDDMTQRFLDEFNSCDAIYGQDAGYPKDYVYAVRNKNIIVSRKPL